MYSTVFDTDLDLAVDKYTFIDAEGADRLALIYVFFGDSLMTGN
jgi:hypothetical protein